MVLEAAGVINPSAYREPVDLWYHGALGVYCIIFGDLMKVLKVLWSLCINFMKKI